VTKNGLWKSNRNACGSNQENKCAKQSGQAKIGELFKTAATSIVVKMNVAKSFYKCCFRNSRTKLGAGFLINKYLLVKICLVTIT
jgi:hypothetical protein